MRIPDNGVGATEWPVTREMCERMEDQLEKQAIEVRRAFWLALAEETKTGKDQ